MSLQVDIKKSWKGFSLQVRFETGEGLLGILGASGCGKSMTLKCIAGIVTPDEGRIL
ncbi:MAG: ATP-binding cassette domain-containing protein, partial [Blautia coccoides]